MAFCFYSTISPPTELCCFIPVIQAYLSPIQNTEVKMYTYSKGSFHGICDYEKNIEIMSVLSFKRQLTGKKLLLVNV